ncbi:hypothetical protein ACJDT4_00950 [Clostridium neuense]|uniref:ABC transporter permease n=1 Tax=Clostridium neuense TaxID=1728934 RepID=A0ABW8T8X0_9CLOT
MNTIIRSTKVYLSYKKILYCMFNIIVAALLSYPGIFFVEKLSSKLYMMPILFLDFALILLLACFFGNDLEVGLNRRFIKTTVISKQINSLVPIIINNVLGIVYILLIAVIKYAVMKDKNSDMQNFADTLFVLLVTVGFISFIKVLILRLHIILAFFASVFILTLCAISKYHFIFLEFVKNTFHNNSSYIILCGAVISVLLNLIAYSCAALDD